MPSPLVVCADAVRRDELVRLVAAGGADCDVAGDVTTARRAWRAAPLVLVDDGMAPTLAQARLPRRPGVVLVGRDLDDAAVWRRGVDVGAEHVVFLPEAAAWVVGRVAETASTGADALVLGVMPGHGGAGASTLAAGIAVTAARLGHRAALVDADRLGGGLDVALGAEAAPGARWPALLTATAKPADAVPASLPSVHGVALLSWDRGDPVAAAPGATAPAIDAARRGARLVVVDLPRPHGDLAEPLHCVDVLLVVCVPMLRAAAAAARVVREVSTYAEDVRLVVRGPSPVGLRPELVAEAVGVPLAVTMRSDRDLAGELPPSLAAGGRCHLGRAAQALLDEVGVSSRGRSTDVA